MTEPFFSVVIPLFNKKKSIGRAIGSVLSQDFQNFELIVIDDGSSDGSASVAMETQDARLNILSFKNGGVSKARNRGIAVARAKFVCFLDADDAWDPWYLSEIHELIAIVGEAGVYSVPHRIIEMDGETLTRRTPCSPGHRGIVNNFYSLYARYELINSSTACIKKSILDQVGGFPEDCRRGEDIYTWLRLVDRSAFAFSDRVSVSIFRDADNRSAHRKEYDVPCHIKKVLDSDALEFRRDNRKDVIKCVLKNSVPQAVGAVRQGDSRTPRSMARIIWRHSKIIAILVWSIPLFPKGIWVHLKAWMDARRSD